MPGQQHSLTLGIFRRLVTLGHSKHLTLEQRQMYTSEKQLNFRTIAKICATHSRYVLGTSDLASPELQQEIAELGQFAEVAYAVLDPEFVFSHLDVLSRTGFPLEGYDAFPGTKLVSSFRGHTADLPGYVAYRSNTRQLVVAFSGTATLHHALEDLRFRKHRHPVGRGCAVHHGFWKMYKGCRQQAAEGIKKGLEEHEVDELVITGHSMGGALAFLLALDLLTLPSLSDALLPPGVRLKVVGYGSPRVGNARLVQLWRETLHAHREKGREIVEYLVKAYNDGESEVVRS